MPEINWTNLYITCSSWSDTKVDDHELATKGIRIFCVKTLDVDEYPTMYDFDINNECYDVDISGNVIQPKYLTIEFNEFSLTQFELNTLRHAFENRYTLTIKDRITDPKDPLYDAVNVDEFPFYYEYTVKIISMPQNYLSPIKMTVGSYFMKFVIISATKLTSTDYAGWIPAPAP